MKRLPIQSRLAAGARWAALLLVLVMLWRSNALAQGAQQVPSLIGLAYLTIYTLLWTRLLQRLTLLATDSSPLLLADVALSMLPVWLTDGWTSPFLIFGLSALVLPTLYRGWRGGLPVAVFVMMVDQLTLWTTSATPVMIVNSGLTPTMLLLGRTLLPFVIVLLVAQGARAWPWLRRLRRRPPASPAARREFPSVQSMLESAGVDREASYSRSSADDPPAPRIWSKDRAGQQTIERRQPASIQAALQHLTPDLRAANVALTVQIEGDERQLPPRVQELLTRAAEVALDNILLHAHARAATVMLRINHDSAQLRITDDGIGLFDGTAEPPGYHQLKRLRFRAQELGGALRVDEREEGGVLLELQVPLVA